MKYPYTVIYRTDRGECGGATRYKSFETAKKHLSIAQSRETVFAWKVINLATGRVEEASGRM